MEPTCILRFDASPIIGAGHAARCLVLANALDSRGWDIILAVSDQTTAAIPAVKECGHRIHVLGGDDWRSANALRSLHPGGCRLLIVDHYELGKEFETDCRGWADMIMAIDDKPNRPHDADVLFDQTLGRTPNDYNGYVDPKCRLVLGTENALIRPDITKLRDAAIERRRTRSRVGSILVSFGYTDPHNATSIVLRGLKKLDFKVTVAIGSISPHFNEISDLSDDLGARLIPDADNMGELMTDADFAIGAAGTSSWERACLGLPGAIIVTGDDQTDVAAALTQHGAAINLGRHPEVSPDRVYRALSRITQDECHTMSECAAAICDGQGASRIAELIDQEYGFD